MSDATEIFVFLAGYAAARGDFSVVGMIIAATVGSVVGSLVLYGLAAWIGPDRLHRFVERKGRWFGLKPHDMERAEAWFDLLILSPTPVTDFGPDLVILDVMLPGRDGFALLGVVRRVSTAAVLMLISAPRPASHASDWTKAPSLIVTAPSPRSDTTPPGPVP